MVVDPRTNILLMQIGAPIFVMIFEPIIQILISRYLVKRGTIISTLLAYGIGLILLALCEFELQKRLNLTSNEAIAFGAVNFVLYSSLAFLFFSFVNIGDTSVRIRILREVHDSKEGLSRKDLLSKYNSSHIIGARIDRLIHIGEMVSKNGRYYHTGRPRMLLIAKTVQSLKKLLLGKGTFEPK